MAQYDSTSQRNITVVLSTARSAVLGSYQAGKEVARKESKTNWYLPTEANMQRIEKRRERDGHKRSLNSVLNVLQPKPHPQRTNAACGWARENLSTKHDHTACATDRNAKGSRQTESSEDDQAMRLSFITSEELVSCVQSFDSQPTVISPTKKNVRTLRSWRAGRSRQTLGRTTDTRGRGSD